MPRFGKAARHARLNIANPGYFYPSVEWTQVRNAGMQV